MVSTLLAGVSLKAFMVGAIAARRRAGGGAPATALVDDQGNYLLDDAGNFILNG